MELIHSLFIATILLGITDGQSDITDNFRTKKYCGSHLSQALSAICKGNYNTLFKKDGVYQKKNYWPAQYSSGLQDTQAYPFQSRSQATSMVSNYRRRRRQVHGVYNECCEKSCSREELSAYCGPSYKRRR